MNAIFTELQQGVAAELKKEGWRERAVYERSCDLRYRGQGYELTLPFSAICCALPPGTPAPLRLQQPRQRS